MVTTRRASSENVNNDCAVDLLERKEVETGENLQPTETMEQAKARMRNNLNKIMGYDICAETEEKAVSDVLVAEPQTEQTEREDIEPTSTTLTFKDESLSDIYAEINSHKEREVKFTNKSKIIIALVAVIATVMLALIIVNASVLASIARVNADTSAILDTKIEEYNELNERINQVSSNENIINIAETDYGMIKAD